HCKRHHTPRVSRLPISAASRTLCETAVTSLSSRLQVAMIIGVPKERAAGEHRVALVPDSVSRLVKGGVRVLVERGAGSAAGFTDADYAKAGAPLRDAAAAVGEADLLCKGQKPTADEIAR